ncbi:MAG: uracil-DNA glycosylase [Verrucomicrobia bacterium]|nr:MAG: uracil-DNA glycosylase [Verrucomicrobiota bacterium]
MADEYHSLLDATIQHLEELKARGVKFVPVSQGTVAGLRDQTGRGERGEGRGSSGIGQRFVTSQPAAHSPIPTPARPFSTPRPSPLAPRPSSAPRPSTPDPRPSSEALFLPEAMQPKARATLSPEAKAAAFADLRQRAMACVKCPHLAASRKTVVFGVGDINAQLMFIGEAPGADEDEQGEPFVGKAGHLLTRVIETMGLKRDSVYIGNILKCRPDTPGQSTGNRKPTPEEMKTCIPYLHEQIDLIQPRVLVALGGTAAEGLLGRAVYITKMRGQWHSYRGIPLMLTYHPAYLLRNQALSEKRNHWEDMLQVMQKLGLTISEKQKGYFRGR